MANPLEVNFCGQTLANPIVLASGILGVTKASIAFCAKNGAGGVTIKSITMKPRKGHPTPITSAFEAGLLNAVGYSSPGYQIALEEYADLSDVPGTVIGSVVAESAADYAFLAKNFIEPCGFPIFEIPLSCPHTPGFGEMAGHSSPAATTEIVTAIKEVTSIPLVVKLSANVPGIGEVAKAAEAAGADAICAVNTLGPGMVLNPEAASPTIGFGVGGVSGPALKPIALRCVSEVAAAVDIPIIGTGGVSTARDAVEMLEAGATLVGVGTAVVQHGIRVFGKIADGLREFCEENGFDSVTQLSRRYCVN